MAMIALHSAASALNALSTSLDVTANNLANANTDGFKSSRANFQDLMYLERRQPGLENAAGDQSADGPVCGIGNEVVRNPGELPDRIANSDRARSGFHH